MSNEIVFQSSRLQKNLIQTNFIKVISRKLKFKLNLTLILIGKEEDALSFQIFKTSNYSYQTLYAVSMKLNVCLMITLIKRSVLNRFS